MTITLTQDLQARLEDQMRRRACSDVDVIAKALDSLEVDELHHDAAQLEPWQVAEVIAALDEYEKDPSTAISLEQFDEKLEAEIARMRAEEAERPRAE